MIDKLVAKALGKTFEGGNGAQLAMVTDMPANCMVLFVSLDTWQEIKDEVEVEEQ